MLRTHLKCHGMNKSLHSLIWKSEFSLYFRFHEFQLLEYRNIQQILSLNCISNRQHVVQTGITYHVSVWRRHSCPRWCIHSSKRVLKSKLKLQSHWQCKNNDFKVSLNEASLNLLGLFICLPRQIRCYEIISETKRNNKKIQLTTNHAPSNVKSYFPYVIWFVWNTETRVQRYLRVC